VEGSLFNIEGHEGWYYVASVESNTLLTLTSTYQGPSVSSANYVIVRDYTVNLSVPLLSIGDTNWTSVYNEAMVKITNTIAAGGVSGGGGGGGSGSLNDAYLQGNTISVCAAPVILDRIGTYGGTNSAPSLHVVDGNQGGVTGLPPTTGSLVYAYSKHRTPILGVTNQASRLNPGSVSTTAPAGVFGLGMADEHQYFTSLPAVRNVGVAGFSLDYHGAITTTPTSNVGVYAYSQRGYALSAYSGLNYAAYLESPSPLYLTNSSFPSAEGGFAQIVNARRGGIRIDSATLGTTDYPGVLVTTAGLALRIQNGTSSFYKSGSPAIEASGSTTFAVSAVVQSFPAIYSANGACLYAASHLNVNNPPTGTIVYSNASSRLVFYDGTQWVGVARLDDLGEAGGGGSGCCTLQETYLQGHTITTSQGAIQISGTTPPIVSVVSTNNNPATSGALRIDTSGCPAMTISNNGSTSSSFAIESTGTAASFVHHTTATGKFFQYTATGSLAENYAAEMDIADGRGIKINISDTQPGRYALDLTTGRSALIRCTTASGQAFIYSCSGNLADADYAMELSLGSGGGLRIENSSTVHKTIYAKNSGSGSVIAVFEGNQADPTGTGLEIIGTKKGIYAEGEDDYAIEAYSTNSPSIMSMYGIVAYSPSYDTVPNPQPGTIVYSAVDRTLYYYIGEQGWIPVSPSGEPVAPCGSPTCNCVNGSVIFSSDINNIVEPVEGTIVYNAVDKRVYFYNGSEFVAIGEGVSGGQGGTSVATKAVSFLLTGNATVEDNLASTIIPFNGRIIKAKASLDNPPQGNPLSIRLRLNGNSITPTQLTIQSGQLVSNTLILNVEVSEYDVLSMDITSIGSTSAGGNDLRVMVWYEEADATQSLVSITTSDSPYTVSTSTRFIIAQPTTGQIAIYLPAPSACVGLPFTVKRNKNDVTYAVIVTSPSGGNIDGSASASLTSVYQATRFVSDGSNYFIV
jgi:hypothetical protein